MQIAFHLLAPLALLLPAAVVDVPHAGSRTEVQMHVTVPMGPMSRPASPDALRIQPLNDAFRPATAEQVSIEQRVTVRVVPRPAPPPMAAAMFDQDGPGSGRTRYIERKAGKCVAISAIGGVQPVGSSKILLIMRDDRLFTAELEKGCKARDYYSGFLVAKNSDGMICTGRDELRSRSGTTCQVSGFRQIVELGS